MPDLRLPVHARLGQLELPRRLALDQVPGHGEGAARKADHRLLGPKRLAYQPNGLEDERHRFLRLRHDQALHVRGRAHRLGDHRPDVLDQLDVHAHAEHRQHDVGEHHRRVHAVGAHGLQRHLCAELRPAADLEEPVLLADLAIFRKGAARLAHEPDRRSLDRFTPAGSNK